MRHPDEGTIHAWLDGALDDAETAWIDAHTRECPACGALVAEARGLVAGASRVLGALDAVPGGVLPARHEPMGSGEAMAGRVMRRFAGRTGVERSSRWMAPVRAAAALLLVAGGTAVVMRSTHMPATMEMAAIPGDTESVVAVPAATPAAAEAMRASATPAPADLAAESAAPSAASAPSVGGAATVAPTATGALQDDARRDASRRVAAPRALAVAPQAALQAAPPAATSQAAIAQASAREEHNDRRVERKLLEVAESVIGRSARQRPIEAPLVLRPAPDSLAIPATEVVVTGTVRDERTGEPVVGASILLDDGDIGTLTDHLGRFTITGTTTGVHRAQVRRTGYASAERELSVVGDSAVLDVRLSPAGTSIAAILGEGYTDVKPAPEKGVAGGTAKGTDDAPRRAGNARPGRPGSRTESASGAERTFADSARTSAAALPFTPEAEERGRTPVPLATRVPVTGMRLRSTQRDAAGSCLTIALSPVGSADAARTITVRLLPTVSRDTTLEGGFAVEFPRAGDVAAGARGSWGTVPRAGEDERTATGVQLHWVAGSEEVRVSLDWAKRRPDGRASVRRGGVGVDAGATATRLECRTVKPAP